MDTGERLVISSCLDCCSGFRRRADLSSSEQDLNKFPIIIVLRLDSGTLKVTFKAAANVGDDHKRISL
jgi:hypothetical protein